LISNKKKTISVLDYGMGNLWSVKSALEFLGSKVRIIDSPTQVLDSKTLIIPGVGSFNQAMKNLKKKKIDLSIKKLSQNKKIKILGICLGMQLLGSESTEVKKTIGLNLINKKISKIKPKGELKVPHIGFNEVYFDKKTKNKIFAGFSKESDFYFVHSFSMKFDKQDKSNSNLGFTLYGEKFISLYAKDNIFGMQFHPEKSQSNGLKILNNFINLC